MQTYIAQRQVEMAGEKHPSPAPAVQPVAATTNGDADPEVVNCDDGDLSKFKDLSTTQMMDFLSRDLVHWQQLISEPLEKSPR